MPSCNRTIWTFAITSIALFMAALDNLVVTTALPVIRNSLGATLGELEWMVNALGRRASAVASGLGSSDGAPQPVCQLSRAIGSRSIVRTWRVRPASVRTSAAGMTPEAIFSITAASPA